MIWLSSLQDKIPAVLAPRTPLLLYLRYLKMMSFITTLITVPVQLLHAELMQQEQNNCQEKLN